MDKKKPKVETRLLKAIRRAMRDLEIALGGVDKTTKVFLDKRTKRNRTRKAQKKKAISESIGE